MIPVIIISETGYTEYTNSDRVMNMIEDELLLKEEKYSFIDTVTKSNTEIARHYKESLKLRTKVLDLLHKEVADCFIYNINKAVQESTPLIQQYKFQIYLKDVIEKAKGESK